MMTVSLLSSTFYNLRKHKQVIDYFDTVYGLFVYLWSDVSVCSV